MSAIKLKRKVKSVRNEGSIHNAGEGSSHIRGVSPTSNGPLNAFYSAGPVLSLKPVVQPKLTIGQPNDRYEREADRVAAQVMRMPESEESLVNGQWSLGKREKESSLVQRKSGCPGCMEEEEEEAAIQAKFQTLQGPLIQRQEGEEEEEEETPIQAKPLSNKSSPLSQGLQNQVQTIRSGGQPLPQSSRAFFESRFGTDFSQVRVHNDPRAAETAQSINAQAYTIGSNIVFNKDQYSPETAAGKNLIAHELTHVVQQSQNKVSQSIHNNLVSNSQGPKIQRRVRFFVCNNTDQTEISNTISMSVPAGDLRDAVNTASDTAADWAYNAASLLRVSPRAADIRDAFHDAFAAFPDWVPPWFATLGVGWYDFGDLIAERLQRVANILSEGWIQYYCWGSPARCPECSASPPTYYGCTSYRGQYLICLGTDFWRDFAAGNTDDMALVLLHEALHIYFSRTVAHTGRSGNAFCYERFVSQANGRPLQPVVATACPTAP
jgi:hypothetical protein